MFFLGVSEILRLPLSNAFVSQTLSLQLVVIILPTIGDALDIPESRLQWVVSAYSLAFGCFLLLWGRIADIYGKRLIFIAGSIWVTIITAVNPFLPNEIAFDLFRGLHGLVSCHEESYRRDKIVADRDYREPLPTFRRLLVSWA